MIGYSENDRFKHVFVIDFDVCRAIEIGEWLTSQFGVNGHDKDWDYEVWLDNGGCYSFHFVHECAYHWFLLRWG